MGRNRDAGRLLLILLTGGHGVAPVGLVLFLGAAPEWFPGMLFGWAGIILEVCAFRNVGKKRWKPYAWLAIVGFLVSVVLFTMASENLQHFGVVLGGFMVPFAWAATVRVLQVVYWREHSSD